MKNKKPRLLGVAASAALVATLAAAPAAGAPNDPYYPQQWGLEKIRAEQAWSVATGAGALIAVVDTGVDLGHPDLNDNIVAAGADFVDNCDEGGPSTNAEKKSDGRAAGNGAGKAGSNCISGPQDENGHGTHVAGIAAAVTGNGVGVAGTAPDAQILAVRVLDADGFGSTEQVADGIRYAADQGADVINLSLGYLSGVDKVAKLLGWIKPVYEAIDYAWSEGSVVVAAAGNDTFPVCSEPSAHPNVVCVGATDVNDVRSWYSNNDATMTSTFLVAPGGDATFCSRDIFSTYLRGEKTYCSKDGYEALAGTSMATPFVSGVSALLAGKGYTKDKIVACLVATTDDLGFPGRDPVYGYGRVNASKAASC